MGDIVSVNLVEIRTYEDARLGLEVEIPRMLAYRYIADVLEVRVNIDPDIKQ